MTTSEIISVAKGLYTNANIDNDYINKLNMKLREIESNKKSLFYQRY